MPLPFYLDSTSLSWARASLALKGTNELLPPSEVAASVLASWAKVEQFFGNLDINVYRTKAPRLLYAPKSRRGFRVIHDLEVEDYIVLSALGHQIAPTIEESRDPVSNQKVFSNRLSPRGGSLFSDSGYESFRKRNVDLAKEPSCNYVLMVDIVDCYNQISTHRVENSLEEAGVDPDTAKLVEELLVSLNLRSSRGIPVGQEFSHLFAESSLSLVDQRLTAMNVNFTRYVDDFRIFCPTWFDSVRALHDVTKILNLETLKLALNEEKTRTYKADNFLTLEAVDPSAREKSERFRIYKRKMKSALEWVRENWEEEYLPPPDDPEDLDKATKELALNESLAESIRSLFIEAINGAPIDYQILRHLLVSATKRRSSVLIEYVLDGMERLSPLLPAVARYFRAVAGFFKVEEKKRLLDYLSRPNRSCLEYSREWLSYLLRQRPEILPGDGAASILREWGKNDQQFLFQASVVEKDPGEVRAFKQDWRSLTTRSRRWLILASKTLPRAERSAFWKEVGNSGLLVEESIVAYLAAAT